MPVTIFTVCLQGESRFCFLVVKEFSVLSMLPLLITELSVEIRKMESQMFFIASYIIHLDKLELFLAVLPFVYQEVFI